MEREGAAVTCDGRLFHRRAAVTGNALSPTVDRREPSFYLLTNFPRVPSKAFPIHLAFTV